MNGCVTLFRYLENQISLYNGFSYVDHMIPEHEHVFIDLDDIQNNIDYYKTLLEPYDKIYCTILFSHDFNIIYPLIDDRWIIGGPLTSCSTSRRISELCTSTTFEKFFGQPISNEFTRYWDKYFFDEFGKPFNKINYMASLSNNCYWGKCKYCTFSSPSGFIRNSKYILSNLKGYKDIDSGIHTCSSATSLAEITAILHELPRLREDRIGIISFIRADKFMLDSIRSVDDLNGLLLELGIESFSQKMCDKLNKGISKKTELDLIKSILQRNGRVDCTIMHPIPGMNKEIFIESRDYLKKLMDTIKDENYEGRLKFCIVGPPQWVDKKSAEEFGECVKLEPVTLYNERFDRLETWNDEEIYINYISHVEKDTDSFKYNSEFFDLLTETKLVRGNNYWYLKGQESCV